MLELDFADNTEPFSPGDILVVGPGDKHLARAIEGPVVVFLPEEAPS